MRASSRRASPPTAAEIKTRRTQPTVVSSSMGGEIVWGNQTDSFALSHWAFVIIVATAIVYDLLLHKLTVSPCSLELKLSPRAGAHSSLSPSHSGHTDGGTVCLPTDTPNKGWGGRSARLCL